MIPSFAAIIGVKGAPNKFQKGVPFSGLHLLEEAELQLLDLSIFKSLIMFDIYALAIVTLPKQKGFALGISAHKIIQCSHFIFTSLNSDGPKCIVLHAAL